MRKETVIELRRHFRAIDIALKKEIDGDKSVDPRVDPRFTPGGIIELCNHATCDRNKPCLQERMTQLVDAHREVVRGAAK